MDVPNGHVGVLERHKVYVNNVVYSAVRVLYSRAFQMHITHQSVLMYDGFLLGTDYIQQQIEHYGQGIGHRIESTVYTIYSEDIV